MFLWISSNSCPLNLLLVRSHQAEIIIVKRLIQGRSNLTRVGVEPRSCNQGRRKSDAFNVLATLIHYFCAEQNMETVRVVFCTFLYAYLFNQPKKTRLILINYFSKLKWFLFVWSKLAANISSLSAERSQKR